MPEIIQEIIKPKFSDQLLQGLGAASRTAATEIPRFFGEKLMAAEQARRQMLENEQLSQLLGKDISGVQDPSLKREILKSGLQTAAKNAPRLNQLQSGLSTIQRMREINKKGGLGRGSKFTAQFDEGINKRRGEYEQLGKSLISLASTIPIRNKAEFETLAENLYDPSIPDAKREGILDAMERIIEQGLQEHGAFSKVSQQKRRSLEEIFG